MNVCRSCGHDFAGVDGFDKHRVGTHAYLADDEHPDGRRCLSLDEMLAGGFVKNASGRWSVAEPAHALAGP